MPLRVVLHAEVTLDSTWGEKDDWADAPDMTALAVVRMTMEEDWSSVLAEALGTEPNGQMKIADLVQSAEWVD